MLLAGTPTDCTPEIISRTISGDEQHAGVPEGLILIPTTSLGPINFAHAAVTELSPVSSFIPCSSIWCTTGCETRLRTIEVGFEISTTRPGNNPGIPSGDGLPCGSPCPSMGGGLGRETSPRTVGSSPCKNRPALPQHAPSTKVRRSIMSSELKCGCEKKPKATLHFVSFSSDKQLF